MIDDGDGDLSDAADDPVTLVAEAVCGGAVYRAWAVYIPAASGGGAGGGICSAGRVTLNNQGTIDSFDSRRGPPGCGNLGSEAVVRTNETGNGRVQRNNSAKIEGDVYVGAGGKPDKVINNPSKVSGKTLAQDGDFEMPEVTVPSNFGPSQGYVYFGDGTLSADLHASSFVQGNGTLLITGNVRILTDGSFQVCNKGQIELAPGASLEIYVRGNLVMSNQGQLNVNTADPSRCKIFLFGGSSSINNKGEVFAAVTDFGSGLSLNNQGTLSGSYVGRSLSLNNQGTLHQDVALGDGLSPAGSAGPATVYWRNTLIR